MNQLKQELTNTINHSIEDFQKQINKINTKTQNGLDSLSQKLKDVETNTYWKIKDYEKLLEQRPTLTFIEDFCKDLDDKILKSSVKYTNEEIEKLLNKDKEREFKMDAWMQEIEARMKEMCAT